MLPELIERRVEGQLDEFCARHSGRLACPQVDLHYVWEGAVATLLFRDGCNAPQPVARFRYSTDLGQWALFSPELSGGWRLCLEVPPTLNFERLLFYLNEDPLNLFWPSSFTCFS